MRFSCPTQRDTQKLVLDDVRIDAKMGFDDLGEITGLAPTSLSQLSLSQLNEILSHKQTVYRVASVPVAGRSTMRALVGFAGASLHNDADGEYVFMRSVLVEPTVSSAFVVPILLRSVQRHCQDLGLPLVTSCSLDNDAEIDRLERMGFVIDETRDYTNYLLRYDPS